MRRLFRRIKRSPDVLWVDLRCVEVYGPPLTFAVWVQRVRGEDGYVSSGHSSPRGALRAAARALETRPCCHKEEV